MGDEAPVGHPLASLRNPADRHHLRLQTLFAHDYPAEYLGDTIEALVIAKRSGLRIRQAAVVMRPRAGGTPSHGPLKAARFLIRAFLALGVSLSRPSSQFKTTEPREVQG